MNTRPALGIRENLPQFVLLVAVNALVGGMVGSERTILPLLAEEEFGVTSTTVALLFIVAFGVAKAGANYIAGVLSDRIGRRRVLILGWFLAIPIAPLLMWSGSFGWVIVANVLLGIQQGFAWSSTVIMKIDLAGPRQRGLAMGLNESAGYLAVAGAAWATGLIAARWGLRPEPFLLPLTLVALGLGLSWAFVKDTSEHARMEQATAPDDSGTVRVFTVTSFTDRTLSSASQAGLVNNLNDGLAWGLFPLMWAAADLSLAQIGLLASVYPAVWGLGQVFTGPLSDRFGRKRPIVSGMVVQAIGLWAMVMADSVSGWITAGIVLGAGTALVYPALLAAVGDGAAPAWRASAVGVYRLWRDLGFAFGAIAAGLLSDRWGLDVAINAVAVLTALSGLVVAVRMPSRVRSN